MYWTFIKVYISLWEFSILEKCSVVLKLDARSKQHACAFCFQKFNDVSLAVRGAGCTLRVCSIRL